MSTDSRVRPQFQHFIERDNEVEVFYCLRIQDVRSTSYLRQMQFPSKALDITRCHGPSQM